MQLVNPNAIRETILDVAASSNQAAHLGGSLSEVDIINTLYGKILKHDPKNPKNPERDIFILSKGHGFLGQIAVMYHYGYFSRQDLFSFQQDNGCFITHPVRDITRGVESSNGSLGQGLSYGLGLAHGFKVQKLNRKVYVLMGDSECSEGSIWEAAILAGELGVENLIAIVDVNGFGNDGYGALLTLSKLIKLFEALEWDVKVVDGHSYSELNDGFLADSVPNKPRVVLCKTLKGKGVAFMENDNSWHHGRVTPSFLKKGVESIWSVANES